MSTQLAHKFLVIVGMLGCTALSLPTFAADVNEKLTTLPLHAGLTFQQEVNSAICGKKTQINVYGAQSTGNVAEYVAWYKDQLKGFHYVHKTRAQEMFYSPDGSKGVSLTENADGSRVLSVFYMKMSVSLTTHELESFSPTNPTCK